MIPNKKNQVWSGKWTFILAATGSAVGLGNVGDFHTCGANGGELCYLFGMYFDNWNSIMMGE